jgi:hypothetical protein
MSAADLFDTGSSAVISDDERYRYLLERETGVPGVVASCGMVNPSKAGVTINDPTIVKLLGFGRRLGIARWIVWNLCAHRATDVKELRDAVDPVGVENDFYIRQALTRADLHIVAWGANSKLPPRLRARWREVVKVADELGVAFKCFGTCKDGHPLHPVMIGYDRQLVDWRPPT